MYATPGFHKEADAFNRVQRGHQAMFETETVTLIASLVAGLQYPIAASFCNLMFYLGSFLYLIGYADTSLNVATARFKRGGGLKWIGVIGSCGMAINVAGKMLGWWG